MYEPPDNDTHTSISPAIPRASSAAGNPAKPIDDRNLVNQGGNMEGAASVKRASQPVPWTVRLQIILFSVRLHLFSDARSMESLQADIKVLMTYLKGPPVAGSDPNSAKTSPSDDVSKVRHELSVMSATAFSKVVRLQDRIPLSRGPTYNGL
jgi:hypothetical protein